MNKTLLTRAYAGDSNYAFVCYAHADASQVYPDIEWISHNACNIWYDEGIAPASSWRDEIAAKILNAKLFLLFLSPHVVNSEECRKELGFALDHKIPILTVSLEKFDLPPGLKLALHNRQFIEKIKYDHEAYRVILKDSVSSLIQHGYKTNDENISASAPHRVDVVAQRYELHKVIRTTPHWEYKVAFDRIKGRSVTLKFSSLSSTIQFNLAREFKLLSRLRHPNIARVFDYGVNEAGVEFLALESLENARSLASSVNNQPASVVFELFVQGLRALHFLHHNHLIHGAVTPDNIVVTDGRLKLVEFAFCFSIKSPAPTQVPAENLEFRAPELLNNGRPTVSSDLFSYGAVMWHAITGSSPPYSKSPTNSLQNKSVGQQLIKFGVDPWLVKTIDRLLCSDPAIRFQSAADVISSISENTSAAIHETVTTRESVLQMAQFVGRHAELDRLNTVLNSAKRGHGIVTFISGESGVGKSRLLAEFETMALLAGLRIFSGHAVEGDSGTYKIWDEVIKHFELILHPIERLTQQVTEKSAANTQRENLGEKSFLKLESMLRKLNQPVVIILEDLHWAGSESIKLLNWLVKPLRSLPVAIVGTFRPEEAFDPTMLSEKVDVIRLERLSVGEIKELAAGILGKSPSEQLLRFLGQETEGNSLFIVETLRVLAEDAGTLNQIDNRKLPERVLSGGMQRILNRRIERLSDEELEALKLSSSIGRTIDQNILTAMLPQLDFDVWAIHCCREAVLEFHDGLYRFTHEKLREYVYQLIVPKDQKKLHANISIAIEESCTEGGTTATSLASHWSRAGEENKAAKYAYIAGEQMLASGALREAVAYLKTVEFRAHNASKSAEIGLQSIAIVDTRLSEAYYRLGNLSECTDHSIKALRKMGVYFPKSAANFVAATLFELFRALIGREIAKQSDPALVEIARIQLRLTDIYFFALQQLPAIWSTLRAANAARVTGNHKELAKAYSLLGSLASAAKLDGLARSYAVQALRISRATHDTQNRSYVNSRLAMQCITNCEWRGARRRTQLALKTAKKCGDLRLMQEMMTVYALIDLLTGNFEIALQQFTAVREHASRIGDRQGQCWGAHGEAVSLIRLGRSEEARGLGESTLDVVHDPYMRTEAISTHCILAIVDQRAGENASARNHIDEALKRLADTPPMAHWMQGVLSCLLEAIFCVHKDSDDAKAVKIKAVALRSLRNYAKYQTLGMPIWKLFDSISLLEKAKSNKAEICLATGLDMAISLEMPFDVALIRLQHAKWNKLSQNEIENLYDSFSQMNCLHEMKILETLQPEVRRP